MLADIPSAGDRATFTEGFHYVRAELAHADPKFYITQKLVQLLDLASQARERLAESHRGFLVGSAALARNANDNRFGVYFGGNFTPHAGAPWRCAEKQTTETVEGRGFTDILAIAVVGEPQIDVSGVESPTLHPCGRCRSLFDVSPLFKEDTLVATAEPQLVNFELHTVGSLALRHETGEPQPFPDYHSSLPAYWSQVLSMQADLEVDAREQAILAEMANH